MTKNTQLTWTTLIVTTPDPPRCLNVPQLPDLEGLEGLVGVLFMSLFGFISLLFGALATDLRDQHAGWVGSAVVSAVFALPVVLCVASMAFGTVRYVRYGLSDSYVRRWHSRHDCPENLGNDLAR